MLFIHQYIPGDLDISNKLRDLYIPYITIIILANIFIDAWQSSTMTKLNKYSLKYTFPWMNYTNRDCGLYIIAI